MELLLKNSRIAQDVVGKIVEFPKYTTQVMNLANQNAQGTRPKVVGQLSELIKEFSGQSHEDLVLTKTFGGFCFQESILKTISEKKHQKYRIATPQDESRGIDGYIGDMS